MSLPDDTDDEEMDGAGWLSAFVVCNFCAHRWVAVYPLEADFAPLQCPRCLLMEGEREDKATVSYEHYLPFRQN